MAFLGVAVREYPTSTVPALFRKPPYKKETGIPKGFNWLDMNTLTGADLENQYKKTHEKPGTQGGILG